MFPYFIQTHVKQNLNGSAYKPVQGKACREVAPTLATRSAALLFLGTLQGLIMQSMLSGDIGHIRNEAPGVFAIYLRGLRGDR